MGARSGARVIMMERVTRPEKYFNILKNRYPSLSKAISADDSDESIFNEMLVQAGLIKPNDAFGLFAYMSGGFTGVMVEQAHGEAPRFSDIALYRSWDKCKQVYVFDRNLSESLAETQLPMDFSFNEALDKLPYDTFYIDAPTTFYRETGYTQTLAGFFVYRNKVNPIYTKEEQDTIVIRWLSQVKDIGNNEWELGFNAHTIGDCFKSFLKTLGEEDFTKRLNEGEIVSANDDIKTLCYTLNHILYVISENSDQEIIYKATSNKARKRRASQATVHQVGHRIGRMLGQPKVHYKGANKGGGKSPKTHVRCGHWHHFWTGPLKGTRHLVLKWVNPMIVNAHKNDSINVVTHETQHGKGNG